MFRYTSGPAARWRLGFDLSQDVKRGAAARDQMYLIVLTQSTTDAYDSDHMDPLTVPGTTPAEKK